MELLQMLFEALILAALLGEMFLYKNKNRKGII